MVRLQISETILFEIEKKQLPARVGEKLVDVLAGEVDSFTNEQLLRLTEICCDMIRNPCKDSKFSWFVMMESVGSNKMVFISAGKNCYQKFCI